MEALDSLISSLLQVLLSLYDVVIALATLILPWTPLLGWIAFWLLAVDWTKLRPILLKGGWLGLLLGGFVMILVWGTVAPPEDGYHAMLGMSLSNYVGKTVYVSFLFVIMFLCGSVQLSGIVDRLLNFDQKREDTPQPAAH